VVVLEPEDIERGAFQRDAQQQQQQQQQQLEQRGEQLEGEEDRLLPGGSTQSSEARPAAADGGAVPPWYRQRTVVRSLFGYGLIAFMYNMLGEAALLGPRWRASAAPAWRSCHRGAAVCLTVCGSS
jgi:hypothetical protein